MSESAPRITQTKKKTFIEKRSIQISGSLLQRNVYQPLPQNGAKRPPGIIPEIPESALAWPRDAESPGVPKRARKAPNISQKKPHRAPKTTQRTLHPRDAPTTPRAPKKDHERVLGRTIDATDIAPATPPNKTASAKTQARRNARNA